MTPKRKHYGRKPSKDFGDRLKEWRANAHLTLAQAATKLGIMSKSPEGYLSQIEAGDKPIPEAILLNIPKAYNVPAEEVLRRAYWPQLPLPLLTAIMEPTELPKGIENFLEELERQLKEYEVRELTRYAAFLLLKRYLAGEQQSTSTSK